MKYNIKFSGDRAIVIEFENEISKRVNNYVLQLFEEINTKNFNFVEELIPTYRSLMVEYNVELIRFIEVKAIFQETIDNLKFSESRDFKVIEVPTLYDLDCGLDLEDVALENDLTISEVVDIHTSKDYLVYMLGFTPGFLYLGGMDERIATSRLATPRTHIKAGSVGIAGSQTGIYSIDSPGGWRIIGKTPFQLFNINRKEPFLINAGDYVRFVKVDRSEYIKIKEQVQEGIYQVVVHQGVGSYG